MKCPDCGRDMVLRKSRKYGGLFYGCTGFPKCRTAHGAHPDGTPLGIPANKETREWRIKAHDAFDAHWKRAKMKRTRAYKWLARYMCMTEEQCHIGRMNIEECKEVIKVCRFSGNYYRHVEKESEYEF